MPFEPFPERIDPYKLFARTGSISSEVPLAKFQRLQTYLRDASGSVTVKLEFGHDDHDRRLITGTLACGVTLQCQRCLGDLPQSLETSLEARVVDSDEEARALPEDMESVVADEGGIDLLAVVEDELILSLPTVPQHENEFCNEEFNRLSAQSGEQAPRGESAFAKLKELKLGKSGDGR